MSDRRPPTLWVIEEDDLPVSRKPTSADLLAVVRAGVESGTIKGSVVSWCVNHRNIAWEDFEEKPFDEFLSRGFRCPAGSWIEGAGAWDCSTEPTLIIPVSDGGSET